jgi:chromosome segregation ATPase
MTQEEKIKDLEERIAIMQASDSELCAELAHCKRVAAGLKGRMQQMSVELQKSNTSIKEKNNTIAGLESQAKEMSGTLKKQANRIEELKGAVAVAEANLEYYKSLPWWKKIFV